MWSWNVGLWSLLNSQLSNEKFLYGCLVKTNKWSQQKCLESVNICLSLFSVKWLLSFFLSLHRGSHELFFSSWGIVNAELIHFDVHWKLRCLQFFLIGMKQGLCKELLWNVQLSNNWQIHTFGNKTDVKGGRLGESLEVGIVREELF